METKAVVPASEAHVSSMLFAQEGRRSKMKQMEAVARVSKFDRARNGKTFERECKRSIRDGICLPLRNSYPSPYRSERWCLCFAAAAACSYSLPFLHGTPSAPWLFMIALSYHEQAESAAANSCRGPLAKEKDPDPQLQTLGMTMTVVEVFVWA